jgi:N-acetylmuramoyl-L-alanine amidase
MGATAAPAPTLQDLRYRSTAQETRVTIEMDGAVPYEIERLSHTNRLHIDLLGARLAPDWERLGLQVNDGRLGGIQIVQNTPGLIRVVLELQQGDFHIYTLSSPHRIVIDLLGSRSMPAPPASKRKPLPGTQPQERKPSSGPSPRERKASQSAPGPRQQVAQAAPPPERQAPQPSLGRPPGGSLPQPQAPTIVLDPGHGGHDPGAVGPGGLAEKTVALQIARELRQVIYQTLPQARVIFTRERDTFVPLKRRAQIANAAKAQLFISIHANSSAQFQARGVETWYLSFAANERAKRIASRENRLATPRPSELELILRNLHETDRINASAALAGVTQASLVRYLGTQYDGIMNRGTDGAPFVVLLHTSMPSILVEVAFISNPREEERLRNRSYQQALAQGIFHGVRQYLQTTLLAAR